MSTFVLVHASTFAAWSWFKVIPRLEQRGHTVIARDLPGHGRDRTPMSEITLERLVDSVCAILDEEAEPVVLVGHSWGGGIITQVAENRPDRIASLAHVSASCPQDGRSMWDCLNPLDPESLGPDAFEWSADRSHLIPRLDKLRQCDCADCSDEDWALVKRLVQPLVLAPLLAEVARTDANFGRVPKACIECLRDRVQPLAMQSPVATRGAIRNRVVARYEPLPESLGSRRPRCCPDPGSDDLLEPRRRSSRRRT